MHARYVSSLFFARGSISRTTNHISLSVCIPFFRCSFYSRFSREYLCVPRRGILQTIKGGAPALGEFKFTEIQAPRIKRKSKTTSCRFGRNPERSKIPRYQEFKSNVHSTTLFLFFFFYQSRGSFSHPDESCKPKIMDTTQRRSIQ